MNGATALGRAMAEKLTASAEDGLGTYVTVHAAKVLDRRILAAGPRSP
jgi:hypothetical protein